MSRTEFDGDSDLADLPKAARIIAVQAHLRRQVERDRQPRLTLGEQVAEPCVGVGSRAVPRVLANAPEATPVHRGLDAAGEGWLAREPLVTKRVVARQLGLRIQRFHRDTAAGFKDILSFSARARRRENRVLPFDEGLDEVRLSSVHRHGRRSILLGGHDRSISLCHERANSFAAVRNLCNTPPGWRFL